ncbi:MAG: hydrogenase expression/formation protein HypE [Flavobacteriaceae bacterium]|nr:hydrogenase expression/formation protein HypE [Flavobacteriaceae bacterium]NNL81596.1 hydrogenase expression/formation protein HypE [Flavobacteriaceae bacterium]
MSDLKSDYNNINLGHGSGGVMTRELLDNIIFKAFSNTFLDKKHDGAIISTQGAMAISTDSFVVSPIFFKGGDIGQLAVHGTVNDVAMCGAIPEYLSLSFIVEEGMDMKDFIKIVKSIKEAADKSDVKIITGDTKVVERGKGDKIFINTTGFGRVHPNANISADLIRNGDKIIVSGPIAQHGMAIMSQREGLEFESNIESDSTNLNFLVESMLDEFGKDIRLLRDPTRGGMASVLCEIADDMKLGIRLREGDLPMNKQVAAACEMLGLDPLFVASEGIFLAFVHPDSADDILHLMSNHEKGGGAAIIGEVESSHPGRVVMESRIGGKRMVTPLLGEQLPRIC